MKETYIGITDFTNFNEVIAMLEKFPPWSDQLLHVGVMSSYKVLHDIPTKWADVFPPIKALKDIFLSSQVYNCLHYADYAEEPKNLCASLLALSSKCGPNLSGVQLDMIWPDPFQIEIFKNLYLKIHERPIEVILQIGGFCFSEAGEDPQEIVFRLRDYENVVDRVLLDKSMGRGKGMDAEGLIPFAEVISENFPHIGLGAAGGLGPDSIELVRPLVEKFPNISIDAQGQLRSSGSALDPIEWDRAGRYIHEAMKLFNSVGKPNDT